MRSAGVMGTSLSLRVAHAKAPAAVAAPRVVTLTVRVIKPIVLGWWMWIGMLGVIGGGIKEVRWKLGIGRRWRWRWK